MRAMTGGSLRRRRRATATTSTGVAAQGEQLGGQALFGQAAAADHRAAVDDARWRPPRAFAQRRARRSLSATGRAIMRQTGTFWSASSSQVVRAASQPGRRCVVLSRRRARASGWRLEACRRGRGVPR